MKHAIINFLLGTIEGLKMRNLPVFLLSTHDKDLVQYRGAI